MQSSTTLLVWARDHTERRFLRWELPVPYMASLHAGLVIAVSPLVSRLDSKFRTAKRLVLRLAPMQQGGRWIGAWYVATAVGFWMAGRIGGLWDILPRSLFFAVLTVLPLLGVAVSLGSRRWLR